MRYKLITPIDIKPRPAEDEQKVAIILAEYFKSNIEFVKRGSSTTPDIRVGNIYWEIKSPRGNGKYTISDNIRSAKHQSPNIVINLSRTKMTARQAESRIRDFLNNSSTGIKRLILITKTNRVIDIKH
jgi:hypothetical protein